MRDVLLVLTVVVIIAAWEIWSVLRDIRNALQTQEGMGALSAVGEKLDAVVRELDRIGGILGGILASVPEPPREPEQGSDWDRLRAEWGMKKPGAK